MSDVERFYYAMQKQINNGCKWQDLPPDAQVAFTNALNQLLGIMQTDFRCWQKNHL